MGKNYCSDCSKHLLFLSFYNIGGIKFCFSCYNQRLKKMNEFKKLPIGYGKQLRILEIMVRISILGKKPYSIKQLRQIAEREIEKMYYLEM